MKVIVRRTFQDVQDVLKSVHRQILYSMNENGYEWNKPYRKSTRVVSDVMGKYLPNGDSTSMMHWLEWCRRFPKRLLLIYGQGNFGSVDGDRLVAMRYTECRLQKVTHTMLDDFNKDIVEFQENYDRTQQEPKIERFREVIAKF